MPLAYPVILETDDLSLWIGLFLSFVVFWLREIRTGRYTLSASWWRGPIRKKRDAMSFADPQSITINAVAQTLPRVSSGVNAGTFQKDDGTVQMLVSHSYGKRTRRALRVQHSKIAPDPLISAQSVKYSMSVTLVVDTPLTGYTVAEAKQVVDALTAYLTASSGAKVTQLLGGEN